MVLKHKRHGLWLSCQKVKIQFTLIPTNLTHNSLFEYNARVKEISSSACQQ